MIFWFQIAIFNVWNEDYVFDFMITGYELKSGIRLKPVDSLLCDEKWYLDNNSE